MELIKLFNSQIFDEANKHLLKPSHLGNWDWSELEKCLKTEIVLFKSCHQVTESQDLGPFRCDGGIYIP